MTGGRHSGDAPTPLVRRHRLLRPGIDGRLIDFNVSSVTGGVDALGDVIIQVEAEGVKVSGRGVSTDVVEASARAYLNAVNKVMRIQARGEERKPEIGP